jgi:methionyl aminopeptidase
MVKPRSKEELELMRESGRISAAALKKVIESIKVGVSGLELDKIAEEEIKRLGGESSFKTVKGYNWTICITVNEQVVHGIPTNRKVEEGDIVSIDLGTVYKGWHTDTAWSVLVGKDSEKQRLLNIGEEALWLGIKQAVPGNTVGDIGAAIQSKVEGAGYSIVRSLVGHGVGKHLHEEPEVPGYGRAGTGLMLQAGMTLAVEVIYNQGSADVILEDDNWTISTKDGSQAGLFEMTIIVGKEPQILTDWRKSHS